MYFWKNIKVVTERNLLLFLHEIRQYPWCRDRSNSDRVTFYGFILFLAQGNRELVKNWLLPSCQSNVSALHKDDPETRGRGPGDQFSVPLPISEQPSQEVSGGNLDKSPQNCPRMEGGRREVAASCWMGREGSVRGAAPTGLGKEATRRAVATAPCHRDLLQAIGSFRKFLICLCNNMQEDIESRN